MSLFIYSFIHSFIHLFIYLFIYLFACSVLSLCAYIALNRPLDSKSSSNANYQMRWKLTGGCVGENVAHISVQNLLLEFKYDHKNGVKLKQ